MLQKEPMFSLHVRAPVRVKVKGQMGSQGGALRGSRTSPGLQNSASPGTVPPATCISSLGQLIKTQTPAPQAQAGTDCLVAGWASGFNKHPGASVVPEA